MAKKPIEVFYQTGRTIYIMQISNSVSANQVYNKVTKLYENYNASNWTSYAQSVPEIWAGYYRLIPDDESIAIPESEIIYEQVGGSPDISDAPPIGSANSQGVNISTVDGSATGIGPVSPTTDTLIVNLALVKLGLKTITSIDDAVESARKAKLIYSNVRDSVLRSCSWNFATTIATLTNLPNDTVTGWDYVYTLPTDCVYVRKVYYDDSSIIETPTFGSTNFVLPTTDPLPAPFRIVYHSTLGYKVIVTNFYPAYIEYTGRIVDATAYDQLFVKAFATLLAAELASILTGDFGDRKELLNEYALLVSEARMTNGTEDAVTNRRTSKYLDARG